MRYFVMEPQGDVLLPAAPKSDSKNAINSSDLDRFANVDYDMRSELISDRLMLLMEMYLPKYEFDSVVYFDAAKKENLIFWRFTPPHYADYRADFRNDGIVSRIVPTEKHMPVVFTARSPKGKRSVVVSLAVAESALRRGIFGVKFTKITDE